MPIPQLGSSWSEIKARLHEAQRRDFAQWRTGRAFGVAYGVNEQLLEVIEQAYAMYVMENARHHHAYPSLKQYEEDIVAMTANLFHGEEAVGNFVSGGTEGIFLVVKTVRDRARQQQGITAPEIVVPDTAYPIWYEVGHYLGVKVVTVPITEEFRCDMSAMRASINRNTVMIMGSAPGYSFGVMDPIKEMSEIAQEHHIHLHVDACVGGYQLPFLAKLGRKVPAFDFALPGVSSIGSDLHKYGYCAIGSSVLLYRNAAIHRYQEFQFDEWRSGVWRNPGMLGSRPGGAVAAAWAAMNFLGESGYLELTRKVTAVSDRLREGIAAIPGLFIPGKPEISVFTYRSSTCDIRRVAETLRARGWFVRPQVKPPSIHTVVTPLHERTVEAYLVELQAVMAELSQHADETST